MNTNPKETKLLNQKKIKKLSSSMFPSQKILINWPPTIPIILSKDGQIKLLKEILSMIDSLQDNIDRFGKMVGRVFGKSFHKKF